MSRRERGRIAAAFQWQGCVPACCFDVAADDQRFLIRDLGAGKRESASRLDPIVNWTATVTVAKFPNAQTLANQSLSLRDSNW